MNEMDNNREETYEMDNNPEETYETDNNREETYETKEEFEDRHFIFKEMMEELSHGIYIQQLRSSFKNQSKMIMAGFYNGNPQTYKEPRTVVDLYLDCKVTPEMKNRFIFRRCNQVEVEKKDGEEEQDEEKETNEESLD